MDRTQCKAGPPLEVKPQGFPCACAYRRLECSHSPAFASHAPCLPAGSEALRCSCSIPGPPSRLGRPLADIGIRYLVPSSSGPPRHRAHRARDHRNRDAHCHRAQLHRAAPRCRTAPPRPRPPQQGRSPQLCPITPRCSTLPHRAAAPATTATGALTTTVV